MIACRAICDWTNSGVVCVRFREPLTERIQSIQKLPNGYKRQHNRYIYDSSLQAKTEKKKTRDQQQQHKKTNRKHYTRCGSTESR